MKYRPIATTIMFLFSYFVYSAASYIQNYNPNEVKNNYMEICQQSLHKVADMSNHKITKEDNDIIDQRCEYVYGNTDYFIQNLKWLYKKYNNKEDVDFESLFNKEYEELKGIRNEENLYEFVSKIYK